MWQNRGIFIWILSPALPGLANNEPWPSTWTLPCRAGLRSVQASKTVRKLWIKALNMIFCWAQRRSWLSWYDMKVWPILTNEGVLLVCHWIGAGALSIGGAIISSYFQLISESHKWPPSFQPIRCHYFSNQPITGRYNFFSSHLQTLKQWPGHQVTAATGNLSKLTSSLVIKESI